MTDLAQSLAEFSAQTGFTVWLVVKFALLIGLLIYSGFTVMIVRQVDLMSRSLNGSFKGPLKSVAWGYFLATVLTLVAVLVFL